jgi:hypothetical protein
MPPATGHPAPSQDDRPFSVPQHANPFQPPPAFFPAPPPQIIQPEETDFPQLNLLPAPREKSWHKYGKYTALAILVVMALGGILALPYYLSIRKSITPQAPAAIIQNEASETGPDDGLIAAVDTYCKELGKAYSLPDIDSGYFISEELTAEELAVSPALLLFKQVDDAAMGSIDCENDAGAMGLSNDLLFHRDNGQWVYIDAIQSSSGTAFQCQIVESYKIPADMLTQCAATSGAAPQPRTP